MNDLDKEYLLKELYRIIAGHPNGIQEFDLLEILRGMDWPFFSHDSLCDNLALFRSHFLLFHLLYALRDQLRLRQEADLDIHCLKIALVPFRPAVGHTLDVPDHLRNYYSDLSHFESASRETVGQMLDQFWEQFARLDRRPEALKILGLQEPVNPLAIKQRYRELVLVHHPDRGGNAETFRLITEAVSVLLD